MTRHISFFYYNRILGIFTSLFLFDFFSFLSLSFGGDKRKAGKVN